MMNIIKHMAVLLVTGSILVSVEAYGGDGYLTIGSDAEQMRSAFNAATGSVRVVMLVSPT